jgi:hypothetical protein
MKNSSKSIANKLVIPAMVLLLFGGILTIGGNTTGDYLIILGTLFALPYILKN